MNCHAVIADPERLRPICIWGCCLKSLKVLAAAMLRASSSATMVLFFDEHGTEIDHLKKPAQRAMAKAAGK